MAMKHHVLPAVLFIACVLNESVLCGAVGAQAYPAKPVRIVVGMQAGSAGDLAFRGIGQVFARSLGQPFVIENRVGADGMIAGEACVRAPSDGYTLCGGDSFMFVLNPVIRSRMPYDPATDMIAVALLGFLPAAILVAPSVPVKTLAELFSLAKADPNSISWGTFGLASSSHLYVEWLRNQQNIAFYNVAYKTAPQAWQALLAGEVQVVSFSVNSALPQVKAGKARMLAINTDSRLARTPDVPTVREAGLNIPILTWYAMVAPAAVPTEIVRRLNQEFTVRVFSDSEAKEQILGKGGIETLPPVGEGADSIAQFFRQERKKYAAIIKAARVPIE